VEPYTFAWDFGDGQQGSGQFVQHTYAAANTYDVTLTVTDSVGTTEVVPQQVVATAPAIPPLTADFTFTETSPLNLDFAASASGGVEPYTFAWDFGDGTQGNGQFAQHAYAVGNTYTVTLTLTDSAGSLPAVVQKQVTATEPAAPSIVETTPILPDFGALYGDLRPIYEAGLAAGNRSNVFAIAGDDTAETFAFLDPFGNPPPSYELNDSAAADLQTVIDMYNTDLGDGSDSFTRSSVATGNLVAQDLLNPGINYDAQCTEPGESLLACELRLTQPSVVIINIGYNDAIVGTDIATFTSQMEQIIQTALNANVIPVVTTIIPRLGDPIVIDRAEQINEAIINTAGSFSVPVFNQWRVFNELPSSGLNPDNTASVEFGNAGVLTSTTTGGANARNFYVLVVLDTIRTTVFVP
jgi:PKD repeat protein